MPPSFLSVWSPEGLSTTRLKMTGAMKFQPKFNGTFVPECTKRNLKQQSYCVDVFEVDFSRPVLQKGDHVSALEVKTKSTICVFHKAVRSLTTPQKIPSPQLVKFQLQEGQLTISFRIGFGSLFNTAAEVLIPASRTCHDRQHGPRSPVQ